MASRSLSRFVDFSRKIIGIGRNYRDHAQELGNPVPSAPIVFLKPPSSFITEGQTIKIPRGCIELHHEVELGVVIGKVGKHLTEQESMNYVGGYFLALDMTGRNFQDQAKKRGHPWTLAKGFDTSCPVSRFIEQDQIGDPHNVRLWLKVNGSMQQDGNTKDMIFTIAYLISYLSRYFTLEPGDVIITGTPSGVGAVKGGDTIQAGLADLVTISFPVEED